MESNENMNNNIKEFIYNLENSINPINEIQKKCENYLLQAKTNPFLYIQKLIYILNSYNNFNINLNIIKIASIQLKNIIIEYLNSMDKIEENNIKYIQGNIITLYQNSIDKVSMKNYEIIIYNLLEKTDWNNFILICENLINNNNLCYKYYGIEIFYLYSKLFEFECEREEYDNNFNVIYNNILNLFYNVQLCYKNNTNNNNGDEILIKKILNKIIKIFIKSIVMSNPPKNLIKNFEKIILIIIDIPINNDLKLNKTITFFLYEFYVKILDKKNSNFSFINENINIENMNINLFNYFSKLSSNNNNDDLILSFVYQYYLLCYNRKENNIINLIEQNLENIINFMIKNNNLKNYENFLNEFNQKDFVFYFFDNVNETRNFIIKVLKKMINNNSNLTKIILNILEKNFENNLINLNNNNNNYLNKLNIENILLLIKVCLLNSNFLERNEYIKYYIKNFILKYLNINNLKTIFDFFIFYQCLNFFSLINKKLNLNEDEIKIIEQIFLYGILINNNDLINIISLLNLPKILKFSKSNLFLDNYGNIIKKHIYLMNNYELDKLIWSLNEFILFYKNEMLKYIDYLFKNIFEIFIKYFNELKDELNIIKNENEDNNNNDNLEVFLNSIFDIIFNILKGIFDESNNNLNIYSILLKNYILLDNFIIFIFDNKKVNNFYFEESLNLLTYILEKFPDNLISNYQNNFNILLEKIILFIDVEKENNLLIEKILNIIFLFLVKNQNFVYLKIEKILNELKNLIIFYKNIFNYDKIIIILKILISFYEMFYFNSNLILDNNINDYMNLIINEINYINNNNNNELLTYNLFLLQLFEIIFFYNTELTLKILLNNNLYNNIFNNIINNFDNIKFDFEYKRLIICIFSFFKINKNNIPNEKINLKFLFDNCYKFLIKFDNNISKKNNNNNNLNNSIADEDKDYEENNNEESISLDDNSFNSYKKFIFNDKQFNNINEDINNYEDNIDEEDDSSWIESDCSNDTCFKNDNCKTIIEKKDIYVIIRDILNYNKNNFGENNFNLMIKDFIDNNFLNYLKIKMN